jgi:hypothetical protein
MPNPRLSHHAVVLVAALSALACDNTIDAGENARTDAGVDASAPVICGVSQPCPDGFTCVGGLCAVRTDVTGCDVGQTVVGEDGCGPDAVCFEELDDTTRCYGLPPCPSVGPCPVGPIGSTCNEGYLLNKHRICLIGQCEDASSCPTGWDCLRGPGAPVLGDCSDGSIGKICYEPSHCVSQTCVQAAPGWPGVCL